ncbi:MAG: hypothetical protein AAGD01_16170 [Acidobacteriota bacterium]
MPGPLVQVGANIRCPHGGTVMILPTNPRVRATAPVGMLNHQSPVAGCPFQIPTPGGPKPQPCVRVQWTLGTLRVKANGIPVINRSAIGMCFSIEGIPQGPPIIATTQMRAKGM